VVLHEFVASNRNEIIARCHRTVETRFPRLVNTIEMDDDVPRFLAQLVQELRPGSSSCYEITKLSAAHAHALLCQGSSIAQVVRHYGDLCRTITELAFEQGSAISVDDVAVLDRCLDDAIAGAIAEHRRTRQVRETMPALTPQARIGSLSRELRETINTARVALRAVKSGSVGLGGSTGAVIDHTLANAHDLLDNLIAMLDSPARSAPPATSLRIQTARTAS
jgi:hypothetical protein